MPVLTCLMIFLPKVSLGTGDIDIVATDRSTRTRFKLLCFLFFFSAFYSLNNAVPLNKVFAEPRTNLCHYKHSKTEIFFQFSGNKISC